jgi:hypothetical protein
LDSAQVSDALNLAGVVRVAFGWQLDIDRATVADIPEGPDRDLVQALAPEYGFPKPGKTKLADLLAAIRQSPLARFCHANGLDPASRRARALYVADAINLKDTGLRDAPSLIAWLNEKGITTLGQLAARPATWWDGDGAPGKRYRRRIETFLSSNPWTAAVDQ